MKLAHYLRNKKDICGILLPYQFINSQDAGYSQIINVTYISD